MDLATGPGPCRLLLEEGLIGRDVESSGEMLSQEGRLSVPVGRPPMGDCILSLRQACLW